MYRKDNIDSHAGFSLIELLVVMAITGAVIGVVLPVLGSAKESARSAVCLSNQRQLAMAAHVHTVDRRGYYPYAYDYGGTNGVTEWDYYRDRFNNPTVILPGFLWQGAAAMEVYQCPSFKGLANSSGNPYTGYNYNTSYIGGYRDILQSDFVPSARADQVRVPSATVIFGDGEYGSGANKFMRSPWASPHDAGFNNDQRYSGTQGFRHQGQTTIVAYCDGHAAAYPQRHTNSSPANQAQIAPGTGFLSEDNGAYDLE